MEACHWSRGRRNRAFHWSEGKWSTNCLSFALRPQPNFYERFDFAPPPFLVKNVKNCTFGFPYQTRTFFTNLSIFLLGPPLELFCIMNLVFRFRQTCKALSPDCGAPSGWPQVKSWYIIGHDFQIYIDINISLSSSHIIQENSLKIWTERISQTS